MYRKRCYILSAVLLIYLIFVCIFVTTKYREISCNALKINVEDASERTFVEEKDIEKFIQKGFGKIIGLPMVNVNRDAIESKLQGIPDIKSAEVYYTLDGAIHINISQRKPILRVCSANGYYVDEKQVIMPLSRRYTPRVLPITGIVSKEFATNELFSFVRYLQKDDLWNAYIEQIIVTSSQELIFIPKVGNFRIVFGALENAEEKMEKLRLFLTKGIQKKGWNYYKEINLKYKNQIVGVKKNGNKTD